MKSAAWMGCRGVWAGSVCGCLLYTSGLRTPIAAAERIKLKYGCALTDMVRHDEFIEVPTVGGRDPSRISRQILAEICEPRMEEILCCLLYTSRCV